MMMPKGTLTEEQIREERQGTAELFRERERLGVFVS